MRLITTAFAALLATVSAVCPNQCSGHGRCTEYDKCVCFKSAGSNSPYRYGYTGADCSQRTCPVGLAYDNIASASQSLTPIVFKSAQANSLNPTQEKLRVYYNPNARSTSFAGMKRDQKFLVKVMGLNLADSTKLGSFTWKLEEDEYYMPESYIADSLSEGTARHLAKDSSSGSGVYVWWDPNLNGARGWMDASSNNMISAGDNYTFALTYNEGVTFMEDDSNSAHQYLECSGRGTCDYTSGKCKCATGYTGEACQRTECPNQCSGHGTCQAEARFVSDAKVQSGKYTGGYDAQQQFGCKCDAGYRGPDCAMIECASGEDPMGGEGGAQGRDCSGRGICDYTSGICKCFKGFYGERCESQTNFV